LLSLPFIFGRDIISIEPVKKFVKVDDYNMVVNEKIKINSSDPLVAYDDITKLPTTWNKISDTKEWGTAVNKEIDSKGWYAQECINGCKKIGNYICDNSKSVINHNLLKKEHRYDCVYYPPNIINITFGKDTQEVDALTFKRWGSNYIINFTGSYDPISEVYSFNTSAGYFNETVADGGTLFMQVNDSFIFAYNFENGYSDWSKNSFITTQKSGSTPQYVDTLLGSKGLNFSASIDFDITPTINATADRLTFLIRFYDIDNAQSGWTFLDASNEANTGGINYRYDDDAGSQVLIFGDGAGNQVLELDAVNTPNNDQKDWCFASRYDDNLATNMQWYSNSTESGSFKTGVDSTGSVTLAWTDSAGQVMGATTGGINHIADYMDAILVYDWSLDDDTIKTLCNQKYAGFFETDGTWMSEKQLLNETGYDQINISADFNKYGLTTPSAYVCYTADNSSYTCTGATDLIDEGTINISIDSSSVAFNVSIIMHGSSTNTTEIIAINATAYTSDAGGEPPADTCTYGGSGDWEIDCSDNCIINSTIDLGDNNIIATGTGKVIVEALPQYTQLLFSKNQDCDLAVNKNINIVGELT
jgi:hypothetical protein